MTINDTSTLVPRAIGNPCGRGARRELGPAVLPEPLSVAAWQNQNCREQTVRGSAAFASVESRLAGSLAYRSPA